MDTIQDQQTLQSKQRLRNEINRQVEAFLHNGGRIEVVKEPSHFDNNRQIGHWPAATELALSPGSPGEL